MEMRSLTMCAKYCMTKNGCKSFSFTENTRTCDTYSKALMETTAASSSSTKFFSKSPLSGVYDYTVTGGPSIQVYLDMDTEDGPWIVIQRRTNGDVDFFRNWAEYKSGFGDLSGNFWLGNQNIHLLTSTPMILRVELEGWDGTTGYAQYSSFQIANEAQNYRLAIAGFSGNVSFDALATHNGYDFSTYDRDNDSIKGNCASNHKSAWWYHDCYDSNLNGIYIVDGGITEVSSMLWRNFPHTDAWSTLKKCTMKIRNQ
ncbi:angiopoietin-related protein 7-like [Argopecten irradians]|uniref:angiopoietin-related protein 7-like n=1 Tax=Argopecten irradians TaxID=31199 RepID=UPI0037170BBF